MLLSIMTIPIFKKMSKYLHSSQWCENKLIIQLWPKVVLVVVYSMPQDVEMIRTTEQWLMSSAFLFFGIIRLHGHRPIFYWHFFLIQYKEPPCQGIWIFKNVEALKNVVLYAFNTQLQGKHWYVFKTSHAHQLSCQVKWNTEQKLPGKTGICSWNVYTELQ